MYSNKYIKKLVTVLTIFLLIIVISIKANFIIITNSKTLFSIIDIFLLFKYILYIYNLREIRLKYKF